MKIGITERGDAGLDLSWAANLANDCVDGAVLITKNITPKFMDKVLELHKAGKKMVLHCGCTGWGGTALEPGAPSYQTQIESLCGLIRSGFPAEHTVFRIDPIFPTENGLKRVQEVLGHFLKEWPGPEKPRVRISVLDEYPHVKRRFRQMGYEPIYGKDFTADDRQFFAVIKALYNYRTFVKDGLFETCAEPGLLAMDPFGQVFKKTGCISANDLALMGLPVTFMGINPQNRRGCCCLSCKTELLPTTGRCQCANRCAYCYWKPDYAPAGVHIQ